MFFKNKKKKTNEVEEKKPENFEFSFLNPDSDYDNFYNNNNFKDSNDNEYRVLNEDNFDSNDIESDSIDKNENNIKRFKVSPFSLYLKIIFILFIFLLLYVGISFFRGKFKNKNSLEVYEVQNGELIKFQKERGMIYRDEVVSYAKKSGYVNFYPPTNTRINKGSIVCTINDNKTSDIKKNNVDNFNYDRLTTDIRNFTNDINDLHFYEIYNYKLNLNSLVSELSMISKLDEIVEKGTLTADYIDFSQEAGVISYIIDGYEGSDIYSFSEKNINSSLNFEIINQNTTVSVGKPLYKIVTNPDYYLVFTSKYDYIDELNNKNIKIKFQNYQKPVDAQISVFYNNIGKKCFMITINKYLERFLDRRFLDFEIVNNNQTGLKVPLTSIVDKNCFRIDKNYLRKDDNGNDVFYKVNIDNSIEIIDSNISKIDDKYCYVSTDDRVGGLSLNTVLLGEDSSKFVIENVERLSGVYNINKGYAVFKNVEIVEKTNEYALIKKNTNRGIVVYDRIVLDANKVKEGDLIS